MPFKSEKQRRYMHANLPKIAKRWEKDYASGGIARLGFANGNLAFARQQMTMPQNYYKTPFEGARTIDTYKNVDPYRMNYLNDDLPNTYRSQSMLPGIQQNNMISNMQKMKPVALDIMTGQYMPGISPHYGGYNPIDPFGNIQMGLENDDIRSGAQVQKQPAWYNKMFNKVGQGITGLTNKMGGMFSGGKNLAGNLIGMAMGIPGLGALLGNMRPDTPYERFQKQMFSDMYGGHDFGNKDPFGKNVRSLFGDYDVREQFEDLAGSKIGEKYGYQAAMADGVVTDEELEEMKEKGLKGFQLERFQALADANKRARDFFDKKKKEKLLTNKMKDIETLTTTGGKTPTFTGGAGQGDKGSWTPGGTYSGGSQGSIGPSLHGGSSFSGNRSSSTGRSRGSHHFAQGGIVSLWPR